MYFLTAQLRAGDTDATTYEQRGIEALRARGYDVEPQIFGVGEATANAASHAAIVALLKSLPEHAPLLASSSVLPLVGAAFRGEARRLRIVLIAHRPSGRDPRFRALGDKALAEVDALTLPYARRVVVPSLHTAMSIGAFGVLPDQLAVVMAAADKAPLAEGSRGGPLTLFCSAPITEVAGHDVLLDALAGHAGAWRLVCAAPWSDEGWLGQLRARADSLGIGARIQWVSNATTRDINGAQHGADLTVLPWRYDPHGITVLESLARGVPVVATSAGAAAQLLPKDAGVLVQAGDVASLGHVLGTWLTTESLRSAVAQGAERARDDVRSWNRVGGELAREVDLACR